MIWDYSKLRGKIREIYVTDEAFADAMGKSRANISQKLNNHVPFTQREMYKACEVLRVDFTEIYSLFFCPDSTEK